MNDSIFKPEGFFPLKESYTLSALERAKITGQIIEGKAVMCDSNCNLTVSLGDFKGIIPKEMAAIGIDDGSTKEIAVLSRVNKQVCCKVLDIIKTGGEISLVLDRRSSQQEALEYMLCSYKPGDIVDAKITHIEPFGVFADIGCGIVGLISIENISVSRIAHPKDRFYTGQNIKAIIKSIDHAQKRFTLSHKELLGTWQENADMFAIGQTVCGSIRSIENYGIFVELSPNLAGLAEYTTLAETGQQATVYIKNIIPEKMKVKLNIIDTFYGEQRPEPPKYYISSNHIDNFIYSPPSSEKMIETIF